VIVALKQCGGYNAAIAVENLEPENSTIGRAYQILLITAWCQEMIDITLSGTCHMDGMLETLLQKVRASGNHSCEIGNEHGK
jgi:hypothetical protein